MSISKHISLKEARKKEKLGRFIKEHPSTGNKQEFDVTLDNMAFKKKPIDEKTSEKE